MSKKINTRCSPKRRGCKPIGQQRTYHNRNWREYNAALVQRGSLTIWIEQDVLESWFHQQPSGRRGASCTYSDDAILMALTLQAVYHLTLRGTEGFLRSVLELLRLPESLPVPTYSTLCRRREELKVPLLRLARRTASADSARGNKPLHVVMDSTGCKVFGEGEWKVRQHGYSKRRTWRKLHLGVDEASSLILAAELTTNNVGDSEVAVDLIADIEEPIAQFSGDGHYDSRVCYQALQQREGQRVQQELQGQKIAVTIPPRENARIWQHGNSKKNREGPLARDENLRRIRQVGKTRWKQESGYHRRSLAETAMFRYKAIFGDKLSSRKFEGQATEALIRCRALNRMTELGMPDTYAVPAPLSFPL